MKRSMWIILFSVIFLTACIQEQLIFFGESENWRVQYEVTQDGECNATGGYVKYIGNEQIPEQVELAIDNAGGTVSLDENGMFILLKGCSNASEGSELEVSVKWNNQSETIPLIIK